MERVVRPMVRTGLVMGRLGVEDAAVAGWIEIRSNAVTAGERGRHLQQASNRTNAPEKGRKRA